jgi:hypothetical protein
VSGSGRRRASQRHGLIDSCSWTNSGSRVSRRLRRFGLCRVFLCMSSPSPSGSLGLSQGRERGSGSRQGGSSCCSVSTSARRSIARIRKGCLTPIVGPLVLRMGRSSSSKALTEKPMPRPEGGSHGGRLRGGGHDYCIVYAVVSSDRAARTPFLCAPCAVVNVTSVRPPAPASRRNADAQPPTGPGAKGTAQQCPGRRPPVAATS